MNRWRRAGHWTRILQAVSEACGGDIRMIDSSSIRVRQCGANGAKRAPIRSHGALARRADDEDPRAGGCDETPDPAETDPPGRSMTGVRRRDMLGTVGPGQTLLVDRGYDTGYLRIPLAARGAVANIKPMPNRKPIPSLTGHSTDCVMWWRGSSTNSGSSKRSPPAETRPTQTAWPRFNSPQSALLSVAMRRWPVAGGSGSGVSDAAPTARQPARQAVCNAKRAGLTRPFDKEKAISSACVQPFHARRSR